MKPVRTIVRMLPWLIGALLALAVAAAAQEPAAPDDSDAFSKEELSQMLAPLALYPDALIAQILMASTYPLEIVEAERWLRTNSGLSGSRLDEALKEKNWDASVKSLCHFPDLLLAMSDKLDQTRKLGDAFLVQEAEVMATIQELRRRAEGQGNLKSSREQKVVVEPDAIRIEPVEPEVVYLPVYDPFYVYGPWWYPAYPPYYWYYPPGVIGSSYVSFGPRFYFGLGFFPWAWFDWSARHIRVDIHRTRSFHNPRVRHDSGASYWRHDNFHRRGVAYRDRRTGERFGSRPPRQTPATPEIRGFPGRRSEPPSGVQPGGRRGGTVTPGTAPRQTGERQGGVVAPGGARQQEQSVSPAVRPDRGRTISTPRLDSPFRGVGEGSFERKAGERGDASRRSVTGNRPNPGLQVPTGDSRRQGREMRTPGGASQRNWGGGGRSGSSPGKRDERRR